MAITLDGTAGVTAPSLSVSNFLLSSAALGTATAGEFEYDGKVPYFTPQGTQRGVIPGMQYYALTSDLVGANVTTAQNVFGAGATLSSGTVYAYECYYVLGKSAGTTSHTLGTLIGGTATFNNIAIWLQRFDASTAGALTGTSASGIVFQYIQTAATVQNGGSIASATFYRVFTLKGTLSVNAGGTFIPQYILNAAPGGAYSTLAGSFCLLYPIGSTSSNISVGAWA